MIGCFLLFVYLPTFQWLSEVPQGFFHPPPVSLARLFTDFPGKFGAMTIDLFMVMATACLTLGIRARLASVVLALTYLVGASFQLSFGKIDHASLFPLTLLCFSLSNWGCRLALFPDREWRRDWLAGALTAVFICLGMLTAGYYKARGWIDFDLGTSGFLNWFYISLFGEYNLVPADIVLSITPYGFECLDYLAVLFELSPFFFLLVGPRSWRIWIVAACLFHLSTTLLLGIHFLTHAVVYLPFLVSGRPWFRDRPGLPRWLVVAVGLAAFLHVALRYSGLPAVHLLLPVAWLPPAATLWIGMVAWVVLFLVGLVRLRSPSG
ncbi:hypothetical protein GGR28_002493 [Lewinella aquimaris]|uniref:HTTM domain-containing protein n=1 Tax=Neolewinella aquimaris TaxID=1835722 RepID=A0A840EG22_9BACT|nr:hypothetical protein [Neolewinella aquimaris]MBB4079866.1 hypothetical protein [Neolewinella aquimaris]